MLEYVPAAQSLQLVDPGATDATDHVASKPLEVLPPREVNSTCIYPVLDVYSVLVEAEPLSEAIRVLVLELHDESVHRYIRT